MGTRKIYDRNFKIKAVQLGTERGLLKVAKELDISHSLMINWQKEYLKYGSESFCGIGNFRNSEQKRLHELKRILKLKLQLSELNIEIFKSGSEYISQGKPMIYHFIDSNKDKYPLRKMCKFLGTTHSSYCKWKNQVFSPRQRQTLLLEEEIKSIFYEFKEIYGGQKITAELQSRGFKINTSQVSVYMKKLGLTSKIRRNRKRTSDARHNHYVFPNLLKPTLNIEAPCQVWLSDINHIQTVTGALYLTIIMDLFDENIVGWSLSNVLTVKGTTVPAWESAVINLKTTKKLIFHSDRGIQYANKMLSEKLESYKYIRRSMNRKGSHCNNAVSSFFKSIKTALVDSNMLLTDKEMTEKVFAYIENWYDKKEGILQ
ncbi:IS3 family transposase [Flavobacterium sp. ANB]|uniref:IS3 family transposase n=1 Tax=unclassified Flavobacterium TaxID=196869 RepID=UPI0012B6CDE2|nr:MULTISPECIES: IS3 family transposase [unclassified Flavobacterium]MBF4515799.1 IS3 family transposase [Flavobacterium sp. ANB]MTD68802.1 IS3 family transposase [Flavobacterium sp. LC2016-13]